MKNASKFNIQKDIPFYSESNIEYLKNVYNDMKAGKNMTEHELIEVKNENPQ